MIVALICRSYHRQAIPKRIMGRAKPNTQKIRTLALFMPAPGKHASVCGNDGANIVGHFCAKNETLWIVDVNRR
jgi:hypothetical protein